MKCSWNSPLLGGRVTTLAALAVAVVGLSACGLTIDEPNEYNTALPSHDMPHKPGLLTGSDGEWVFYSGDPFSDRSE